MTNRDIDQFFRDSNLDEHVERNERPPNVMWFMQAGNTPILIQTQEDANRMRIVGFIEDDILLDKAELVRLLEANYHTALDVRYAITDNRLVAAFIHPLAELTSTQFILGFHQVVSCAEICGREYSGGTMVFGATEGGGTAGAVEGAAGSWLQRLAGKIRGR
jgi:hypothetical protein